jgi:hypothetical protein
MRLSTSNHNVIRTTVKVLEPDQKNEHIYALLILILQDFPILFF